MQYSKVIESLATIRRIFFNHETILNVLNTNFRIFVYRLSDFHEELRQVANRHGNTGASKKNVRCPAGKLYVRLICWGVFFPNGRSSYISEHFWLIHSLGCKSSLSFDKRTESKE